MPGRTAAAAGDVQTSRKGRWPRPVQGLRYSEQQQLGAVTPISGSCWASRAVGKTEVPKGHSLGSERGTQQSCPDTGSSDRATGALGVRFPWKTPEILRGDASVRAGGKSQFCRGLEVQGDPAGAQGNANMTRIPVGGTPGSLNTSPES